MKSRFKVAVLISGRGSNLKAILAAQNSFQVVAVISDKAGCAGLDIAKAFSVPQILNFDRAQYASKAAQKDAIYSGIINLNPDLVCLAGFMQIIEPKLIQALPNKIINIHPSLLPKHPGLNTHQRAIDALTNNNKDSELHGCTVHLVDTGIDSGKTLAQASLKIQPTWDAATLESEVLKLEHQLYPWVIENIAKSEIKIKAAVEQAATVEYSANLRAESVNRKFIIP